MPWRAATGCHIAGRLDDIAARLDRAVATGGAAEALGKGTRVASTPLAFDGMDRCVNDARRCPPPKVSPPPRLSILRLGSRELAQNPDLARGARLALNGSGQRGALLELWLVQVQSGAGDEAGPASAAAPQVPALAQPRERAEAAPAALDRAVRQALELMQGDVRRRWSVQSLAKAVGVSRAAFARRFKAALGEAPIAYLTELRLALAARLLIEEDASLAEVATRVGYDSEFAFSRAFKRRHELPPATFRRQQRQSTGPRCLALAA
jgi:AraC-like DNA-binding protein